jgi:L-threonylcarbamoyladenylate synthase
MHLAIESLRQAVAVLRSGGVIVFPTDTVYGLAANAFNMDACKRIYSLKGRSFHKPLIVMPQSMNALRMIAQVPNKAEAVIKKFWPGPLTLVLNTTNLGKMLMAGRSDVGVRMPNCEVAVRLLKLCDFPLATTSANPSRKPSAKTAKAALEYFSSNVDMVIDGGPCTHGAASTVVDMTHFPGTVVREGALDSKKLLRYL